MYADRSMRSLPLSVVVFIAVLCVSSLCIAAPASPHIVFIVADDLGWNDIGFNNPDIKSPNIDDLAKSGVILNQTYVQPLCSPSRAALMTGMYPFHLGLQHLVIVRGTPVCVPLNKTLLPEVLKKQGYATHMVGKWHLGMCKWECTPTYRGFDSFYGYYNSMEDYYTKIYAKGFDFRDNKDLYREANGTYSSYLYTDRINKIIGDHDPNTPLFLYLPFQNVHEPLEVPQKYFDMYPNIKDKSRRTISGMVTALDDAIGDVVTALKQRGLYDNTLIVFTADNGGWTQYAGNNYPLRGGKFTIFEGGTRAVAFVHGPMFNQTGIRYDGVTHMVDWFPTLVDAAGSDYKDPNQDGVSQWESLLSQTVPSKRQELVYNLDYSLDPMQGRAAIRVGDYKLVAGYPGMYPDWYKPAEVSGPNITGWENYVDCNGDFSLDEFFGAASKQVKADAPYDYYLFNVKDDPTEHNNLYDKNPDIVKELTDRLNSYKKSYVKPNFPLPDPKGNPDQWNGAWTPGWC